MPDLTCAVCGGKDFYKNAGYFFCSECQTQAPDVQEQEFEVQQEEAIVTKTRKSRSPTSSKTSNHEQFTSWECYNYILLGLVNELIELGANANLKPIAQTIWFKYLLKLEVLHRDACQLPKLPAYNNKHDAKVIFGRCQPKKVRKRKRQGSESGLTTSGSEGPVSKREQNRLKRAMAKAVYESQQTQSTQQLETSILNQSLGSLQSSASNVKKQNHLCYSKQAKGELLSHMSKEHLHEHVEDVDVILECHTLSYKDVSTKYSHGPHVMTLTKLYVIIYLALLIGKDDIQLGDMLRFMEEGSLSYNHYAHFFPEDVEAQAGFLRNLKPQKIYKADHIRLMAGKMAALLQISAEIPSPNLPRLIERYCGELNLPHAVRELCMALLAELRYRTTSSLNHEGRAVSVVVFVLKLLFGLDGVTEVALAELAQQDAGAFDLVEWLQTLTLRCEVLAQHHFPTGCETSAYIDFMRTRDVECKQADAEFETMERVVFRGDVDEVANGRLEFGASLTPLHDHLRALYESGRLASIPKLDLLLRDYAAANLHYLRTPQAAAILQRGACVKMAAARPSAKKMHVHARRRVICTLGKRATEEDQKVVLQESMARFWLRLDGGISQWSAEEFSAFWMDCPYHYRLIVAECARITRQSVRDVLVECMHLEAFVSYGRRGRARPPAELRTLVAHAQQRW